MDINFVNEIDFLEQHISDLLKNTYDDSGLPISLPPTLLNQLLPAFFVSFQVEPHNANFTEIMKLRNDGYLYFFQSLSNYTVKEFKTLSITLLERILLQAHKLLPLTKIASCLQLDDSRYNAQHDACDRLTILLGMLFSRFGTLVVDSFLHPLFTTYIIKEKQPQPQSQSQATLSTFKNSVQARGGSFENSFQQTQLRWNCVIKYRLARNTPFVTHQRNGQSKKQARHRTLQDILNYYTSNDASLVLHCSSASPAILSPGQSPHPHCQQLDDDHPEHIVEMLSIPTDKLYDYDDSDSQQSTSPSAVLSVKRSHNNMMEDSDMNCITNNSNSNINEISFLTNAILYDFSNLSFNDTQPPSSTSDDSPAPIDTLKLSPSLNGSNLATSTSKPLPTSTINSSIKTEPMNEEWEEQPTTAKEGGNKKQRMYKFDGSQQAEDIPMEHQQSQQQQLLLSIPVSQQQQQQPQQQAMDSSDDELSQEQLSATAISMVSLLPEKSRQRTIALADQLSQQPGNVKSFLINLAAKLDGGEYTCSIKHTQPTNNSNNSNNNGNNLPYFRAMATLATPGLKLVLVRCDSKKTDAEIKAAWAIFELLVNSITTMTNNIIGSNNNITNNNNHNCTHPSPLPPSEIVSTFPLSST